MAPEEWDDLGWDLQRLYLDGLAADESVPFHFTEEAPEMGAGTGMGPVVRENVDAGTDVIDLGAMRDQLEDQRRRKAEGR